MYQEGRKGYTVLVHVRDQKFQYFLCMGWIFPSTSTGNKQRSQFTLSAIRTGVVSGPDVKMRLVPRLGLGMASSGTRVIHNYRGILV